MIWRCVLIMALLLPGATLADRYEPSPDETAFARDLLNRYQPASFRLNVEYCGYILRTKSGTLSATPAARGDKTSCLLPTPKQQGRIIASWHTHAGFNPDAFSEVPSLIDLDSDVNAGIPGWVATPGGRFWLVDHLADEVRLICGPNCLITDPLHVYGFEGQIPNRIPRARLERWGE